MLKPDTLTADAGVVDKIAALARSGDFKIIEAPEAALPAGALAEKLFLGVVTPPNGKPEIVDLSAHVDRLRGKPARRKGTATAATIDSFIDLVNRHGSEESAVFVGADWRKPKLTAVLNYHAPLAKHETEEQAGKTKSFDADEKGEEGVARFGDHRVLYEFPLSEPWKQWLHDDANQRAERKENPLMDQEEFAKFIENHVHELVSPSEGEAADLQRKFRVRCAGANDMLDLARGLEVTVGRSIKSQTRLPSGERAIMFAEEHANSAGQPIDVPGLFMLEIPLFYRGDTVRVTALLRYRAGTGGVKWAYELYRPDEIVDGAVRRDVTAVAERTGLPCYDGAPEQQ